MSKTAPKDARPGRREARRLSVRRELVLAGRRRFSREGIYSSRIEDIAHEAGIAKGSVYLHFRSKEELLTAVVQMAFDQLQAHVRRELGAKTAGGIAEDVFRAHVEFYVAHPDYTRILHQVRGLLKFTRARGAELRACLRQHLEFLATALSRGEIAGWSPARRRELASFLFGTASGMVSVLVASQHDKAELARLAATWSAPIARAADEFAARAERRRPARRA